MSCRPSLQEDLINRLETAGVIDQDLRVLSPEIIPQLNRIYDEYGQHLFSVNNGYLTIHRDLLDQIDLATSGPVSIASTIYELEPNITEDKIQSIYTNYVNLMNRAREGKAMSFNSFMSVLKSFQVYKYKDTYIFGQYDTATATFITRVNSSPSSKELLAEAIPNIVNNGVDFISFVPKDYADKLVRSGYTSSIASFGYNFKGEDMQKFAVASNPQVFQKIFNKGANQVTAKEIEAFNNSKEFKYSPVEVREDLIKKAGKDASKILETYLKQFGIAVKDIKEIQNQVGLDEVGFADILSKIAYVKNRENLPPVAGEFIAFMMQYNPLVEDIIKELSQTDNYKGLNKTQYLKIIGELIAEDLQNKLDGRYNKSLIDKIKDLVNRFFELIKNTPVDKINTNIGIITNNILQQNKKLITSSLYKPGAFGKPVQQVSIESALKKDKFGASIVKTLSSQGFVLTGSTALSEQGLILRPDENPLHDIDWVSPFSRAETQERFLEKYPDAIKVRDIYGDDYVTDSYLIAPEGYSVVNYIANSFDGKIIINSYDIADSDGNIVGTYRLGKNPDTNANEEIVTGVEGKVIDFFSYSKPKERFKAFKYQTKDGDFISLSNWKDIFSAKLAFARYKDIWDYNRFIPNENVQIPAFQETSINTVTESLQDSLNTLLNGRLKDQVVFTDNIEATYRTFDNYDEIYESLSLANELGVNDLFVVEYFKSNKLKVAANKIKTPEQLYEQIAKDIESEFSSDKFLVTPLTREKQLKEYEKAKARDIEATGVVSRQTQMMQSEDYWERTVEEVNRQREDTLKEWRNYITKENPEYSQNPALQYLFWKAITKEYNVNKTTYRSQPPVLNRRVLADLYQKFMDKEVMPTTASFKSAYDNMLVEYIKQTSVITQVTGKDTGVGEWITIKGKKSDPDNFKDNVTRLRSLAYSSWCVKSSMAESYLNMGDFHIYIEKDDKVTDDFLKSGRDISEAGIQNVKVGVGVNGNNQVEVQGQLNNNKIPLEYYDQIVEFIDIKERTGDVDTNQLKRTRKQLNEVTERRDKIKAYREKLKSRKPVEFKNTEQYLRESGSVYYKRPDGKFVVQELVLFNKEPMVIPDVVELDAILMPQKVNYSNIDNLKDSDIETLILDEDKADYPLDTTYFPDLEIANRFITSFNSIKVTSAPGLSEDIKDSLSIVTNFVTDSAGFTNGATTDFITLQDIAIHIKLPSAGFNDSLHYDNLTNQAVRPVDTGGYYDEVVEESAGFFVADLKPDGTIDIFETDNLEEAKSVLKSSIDNYHIVRRAQDTQPYDKLRVIKRTLYTDKSLPSLVIANNVRLIGDAPNLEVITGNIETHVPKNVKYIVGELGRAAMTYPGTSPVVIQSYEHYNFENTLLFKVSRDRSRKMLLQKASPVVETLPFNISDEEKARRQPDLDLEAALVYDKIYNKILEVAPEVINENLRYRDLISFISNRGDYLSNRRNPINSFYRVGVTPNSLQTSRAFNQGIQAFYNKADGKVYVSTKLSPQEQAQVLLHEVIGHKGIEELLSDVEYREYKNILFGARDFLYENAEALIARTGHKSLQDLAADYQFDLNTEKGQLGLIKELLARQAEVNPNLSWFERLVGRLQIFLAKVFGTSMSREGVIELLLLSRDKLNNPNLRLNEVLKTQQPDQSNNLINELFVSGAIDIIDSNPVLYNYDRKTFDDIEALKAYADNKLKQRLLDPNIITSDRRPSISLNGRTKEQAIQDEIRTQVSTLIQTYGTGSIKSQRIAREINQTFNAKIATEVNGKVEILIPNSLYYQYSSEQPDYVIDTDLTNIYADSYGMGDFSLNLSRKNNEVIVESYHPAKAEETIKLLTLLSKNKFIVKSYQPSMFWETLLQMDMAVKIDNTYYLTPKPMTQEQFDSAYRQIVERPDLPIDVSGTEQYRSLIEESPVLPETDEDLSYCNV